MRKQSLGVSLIELMIALLIGSILLLGLVQVFDASRTAYQLSQGVARAQENGRFAMDYLQRDIRMLGHFGCVNDQARLQTAGSLSSHLAATDNALNFNISLQGYDATATAPTNALNLAAPTDNTILRSLGVRVTPPGDTRYRSTYESTIALRNRLYGN